MQAGKEEEVSMTGEDQQMINTFSRLNNHLHDLDDQIEFKKAKSSALLLNTYECMHILPAKKGDPPSLLQTAFGAYKQFLLCYNDILHTWHI